MNTPRPLRLLASIALIAALLSIVTFTAPARAGGRHDCPYNDIDGTYLFNSVVTGGTMPGGSPGVPPFLVDLAWQGLMTLHDDGTVVIRHSFSNPGVNIDPGLGVWTKTGRSSIKVTYLVFIVPRLQPGAVAELSRFTCRITLRLERDRSFPILDGTSLNEVFLPAQDPLDPDEVPFATVSATIANARPMMQ